MKLPTKGKIYVKFKNGKKMVETYVESNEERKSLYELIREEVFGSDKKTNKIGFNTEDEDEDNDNN